MPERRRRRGRAAPGWLAAILCAVMILAAGGAGPADASATEVRLGIVITSLSDVEPQDGSFTVSGFAWFVDPAGTFDPQHGFEIISRSSKVEPFASAVLPDGAHYSAVSFSAVIDHAFDVRRYPFDRQSLIVRFEAASTVDEVVLVPDLADSIIYPHVRIPGWRIAGLALESGSQSYDSGFGHRAAHPTFSMVTATVAIERNISPFLFEKFTGFFVALAITGLVLFVPVDELGTRIGMTTGSVFAAVFNRYRLEDAIGYDAAFGTVDQVTFLTFSAILLMLMLSIHVHRLNRTAGREAAFRTNVIWGAAILGVHAFLIAVALGIALV